MRFAPSASRSERLSLNSHRDLTPSFHHNAESKPRSPGLLGILLLERTGHDPHNRAYATNRLLARGHSYFDYAPAAQLHRRDLLDHIGRARARAVSLTPPCGEAAERLPLNFGSDGPIKMRSRVTISRCRDRLVDVGSPGRVHTNPAFFGRVAMEKDTMKHMRAFLAAAAFACVLADSLGFAKTPEPAPAGNTPTPAAQLHQSPLT
jgi:hypothetical protein